MSKKSSKVYFIKDLSSGRVKIGKAINPLSRLKALQVGSSNELKIIKTITGGIYLEQILHKYFKHLHIRGEWFKPDYEMKGFLLGKKNNH